VSKDVEAKVAIAIIGTLILLNAAFWGSVAYVVVHFIEKFW